MSTPVELGDRPLRLTDVWNVAAGRAQVTLSPRALARVDAVRAHVDALLATDAPFSLPPMWRAPTPSTLAPVARSVLELLLMEFG